MMEAILLTIPPEEVSQFIDHLAKYSPKGTKSNITLRLLSETLTQETITKFENPKPSIHKVNKELIQHAFDHDIYGIEV